MVLADTGKSFGCRSPASAARNPPIYNPNQHRAAMRALSGE